MSSLGEIEQLFHHPQKEIQRLEHDLKIEFGTELSSYIKNRTREMTTYYHDECAEILLDRFVEMNKRLKSHPNEPSKDEHDEMIQDILHLAQPSKIAEEIRRVINTTIVYDHYLAFIDLLERDIYYEQYQKFAFTKEAVVNLNKFAFVHLQSVMAQLNSYIESLREHNTLVQKVQKGQSSNQVLKVGASILGMGVGIPFLGTGLGALLSSGDKGRIQDSLGNIFSHIEFLEDALYTAVQKLGDAIYLLFLTLVGGTFITVNRALHSVQGSIKGMTSENIIEYALLDDEARRFEKWYDTSIAGVTQLAQQERWQEAIVTVKRMHEQVVAQPIHARHCVRPNQAALYLTHVHYYAVYQEALLAEYQAGHIDSFLLNGQKFLNTLILYPLVKDFPAFSSPPAKFIFLYIKQYMKKNGGRLLWMEDAEKYIEQRYSSSYFLEGEYTENYLKNTISFLIAEHFYVTHEQIYNSRSVEMKEYQQDLLSITEEDIKTLIKIDASLKDPDALTTYLSTLISVRKEAKRAPLIKWTWRLGIVAALLMIMLVFSDTISGKLQSSKAYIGEKWSAVFMKGEATSEVIIPEEMYIKITEPTVNIRNTPSLQGTIIGTGYGDETYVYLNEEQIDNDGVTWLTIQLVDGQTGYVSKKIAVIQ